MKHAIKSFSVAIVLGMGLIPDVFAQSALRVGDTVEIRLAGVPSEEMIQFSGSHPVDEAGKLNLPFIGLIKAAGLQANQLQAAIENKLKEEKIYTRPTVTVIVANNMRLVNVRGAVRTPMRVSYTPDLTLMSAINAAGGFNDFAGKKVLFSRDGKAITIDINKIIKDPSKDFPVQPGDTIEALPGLF